MPAVTYVAANGTKTVADVPLGENVMRGAVYNSVDGIAGECGGGLSCATCHVYVDDAWTAKVGAPVLPQEKEMLESAYCEVRPTSRLSCQIVMTPELDGLVVHMPEKQSA